MPERITDERAAELSALLAIVKPGDMMAADHTPLVGTSVIEGDWESRFCQCEIGDRKDDDESPEEHLSRAEYIAAMLNAAPLLLLDRSDLKAENARLRWKLAEARKVADEYYDHRRHSHPSLMAEYVLSALESEPPTIPAE